MAVRLNVVMVHSPPPTVGASQLAESIVGELIGRPGIDVTLVGSLDAFDEGSTDAMTLQSITSDVAFLDWMSPDQLISKLSSIGFDGVRSPHAADPSASVPMANPSPDSPGRRIYAFDLRNVSDAQQLCESLQGLLANRRIKTITIGGDFSRVRPTAPIATPTPPKSKSVHPSGSADVASPSLPSDLPSSDAVAAAVTKPAEIDLDDLVDQLDQLDP